MFPDFNLNFATIKFPETISVFALSFNTSKELAENWEKINLAVAGYYQAELDDAADFQRWNIYIFYLCQEPVAVGLKYKIQNDKFSSRKIVVEEYNRKLTKKGIDELIAGHITNTDLIAESREQSRSNKQKYFSDSVVWKNISHISLPGDKDVAALDRLLNKIEEGLIPE